MTNCRNDKQGISKHKRKFATVFLKGPKEVLFAGVKAIVHLGISTLDSPTK